MEGTPGRRTPLGEVGASLAGVLQQGLPPGAQVAVCWQEEGSRGALGGSGVPEPLAALAEGLLADPDGVDAIAAGNPRRIGLRWQEGDVSTIAMVVEATDPLDPGVKEAWRTLGTSLLETGADLERLRRRVVALEKSERLQQALYGIADLAGSDLELEEMLERIHSVVAGLMYAENFYIALYDDVEDAYRFLYFADRIDPFIADPDYVIRGSDNPGSLTLALLRQGEPAQGPAATVREQLGLPEGSGNGPDSHDWLGVPMRREERVCGAVVVQSYDQAGSYGPEERALLVFVAQHILTALDRHQAREELERRVEERTQALQQSNRDLQAEIVERQRGERLQRALFRIAELSITSETLERFYAQVHDVVGELLYARNFYIALRSSDGRQLEFPYSIDERDARRDSRLLGAGMTEYVLTSGSPILADRKRIHELEVAGLVRSHGTLAHCWLGVPLYRDDVVVGVIAVQSYSPAIGFSRRDQELLTFVAHHIGIGLMRKQSQDRLVAAHAELEQRVEERTGELARANAELLEQIGERLRAEQRLTHQARHDALTGLPNRQQLLDRLTEAITAARGARLAAAGMPARTFAVLFLDLDRFKLVNDSVGHSAGDELLVEAGRRIVGAMREGDTVARLGGDEFAILVEGIEGLGMAEDLARRVLLALGRPCWVAGREVFPSASLGIALWHPRYRSGAELLRDADAAMYRAKAEGRDRCAVFDEDMREEAVRILDLEADLRRAINSDSFVPHYQPIVRLSDGEVIGHEALLRWRHPSRGLLSPGEFIGLGEDSGLIEEVDWLMYAQVIGHLSTVGGGYISVNVSPRHFRSPDFAERLLRLVETAGADPSRLRIEITEVSLLDDAPRAMHTLSLLREHGIMAQLDDFGTGYSALSYLHRFPIECLKIDQSFVAGLIGDNRHESIAVVRAIQALAGTLGIHTVGEGVETREQLQALQELGCRYGQGYLLGRPAEAMATRPVAVCA